MKNEYDDLLASDANANEYDATIQQDGDQQRQKLRASIVPALNTNPDQYGQAKQLSRQTGIPAPVAERNLPEVAQQAKYNEYDKLLLTSPTLGKSLQDPDFAKLSHDDIEALQAAEARVKQFGEIKAIPQPEPGIGSYLSGLWRSVTEGGKQMGLGLKLQIGDALPTDAKWLPPSNPIADEVHRRDLIRQYEASVSRKEASDPGFESSTAQGVYSGFSSLLQQAPGTVLSIALRNPAPALAQAGIQQEAQSYAKYVARGATPREAFIGAAGEGVTEVATEMLPMSFLVKNLGRVGAGRFLAGLLAREVPSEQIATAVEDAIDTAIANPDKTWAQYFQERPEAAYQTLIATLTQAGVMEGGHVTVHALAQRKQQAQTADQHASTLQQLNEVAGQSKLRQRDPESFAKFVEQAAVNGPVQDVYVDANTLVQTFQQSGADPSTLPPSVQTQLGEALAANSDVRIPLGEYAASIAGTDLGTALLPHLRTSPEAMSQAEAQQFMQGQAEEFKREAEKILAEKQADTAWQQSAKAVEAELMTQLKQANRFTNDVNTAYATLMRDFYVTTASRLGITPQELFHRYPLQIRAESVAGGTQMDQAPSLAAVEQSWNDQSIQHSLSENGNEIAVGKIVVPEESRGQGIGTRAMQQLIAYADQTGKRITLSPSTDFGGSSAGRLTDFYKSLGFVENKGKNRDFSTRASMVREPVANAKGSAYTTDKGGRYGQDTRGNLDFTGTASGAGEVVHGTVAGGNAREGWAQSTRIRGKDGQPLAIYRGASVPLAPEHFDLGALGAATGRPSSGLGVWFTISEAEARSYGEAESFNLDVRNPKVVKVEELPGFNSVEEAHAWREGLRQQGHDGIIVTAKHLGGRTHIVAFDPHQVIYPQPKAGEFYQPSQGGSRGSITFPDDIHNNPSVITLLQNADLSTFLHESGHFYLEVLNHVASQPNAPVEIQQDMQKLLDWFGVKDQAAWNALSLEEKRPHHETFARGFEAYLFEGKAPNQELNGLFARFRAWMLNVYKSLTALNVQLTDEVRGVMDRMLATNQEIQAAEAARNYVPLFKSMQEAGMTPEEWQAYQHLGQQATQEGIDELQKRGLRDMQWLANARSDKLKELQRDATGKRKEVQREVTAEVHQQPVYAAIRTLTRGELPNGEKIENVKLSLPALKEMYGEAPDAPWRQFDTGRHGLAATEGLHPDKVAEMFGFTSGDHLVRAILAAQPERVVIEGMTDQRMLERYGDLADPKTISRAANEAIHNEVRARFIATELKALAKATGQRNVLVKAAKEFAATIIARKKVRDIKPAQYEAAEARAAKAAEKTSDLTERAVEKRNQLVNHYATRAAYNALGEIEAGVRYLRKFDNESTRKKLDPEYTDQIDKLLERFDLRTGQSLAAIDKRSALADWIKSQEEQGLSPIIDDQLRNEAFKQHFRDLPLEQFRGLVDAVKNIEHLGRLKNKLLTALDKREFDAAVDEIVASTEENAKKTIPEQRSSDRGLLVNMGRLFRTAAAIHRKFSSLVREMDGFKDGGPAWEYLVRNMNERGNFEAVENEKATMKLAELLAPIMKTGKLSQKQFFPAIGKSFTREERIGIALNMGNETNRERVMSGEKLNPAQLQTLLDTLTKEEWDFVQGVWDHLDSYRAQIGAKEKRVSGVEPEWVQPSPVQTKFGEYKGGYYPIAYDPLLDEKASADVNAEVQRQLERGLYVRAQTARGHTKARVESTGRPLRYDFGDVISRHITQVVHDLAWHEYLIDANRLLRSKAIQNTIRSHYGPEVFTEMKDALKDIAVGNAGTEKGAKFFNHLRYGATIAGLGINVFNSLQNLTGITQSFSRVGTKWVLKGAMHWMGDAASMESSVKKIYAKSEFMRLRSKTMLREINEIRNKVSGKDSRLQAAYFYLQNKTQIIVDVPTWWGAYEKAMSQDNTTEDKAVALADQAVLDAQGGGQIKDLAGIQRGGSGLKLFTTFYSFFNTTFNNTAEAYGRTDFRKPGDVAMFTADMVLLYAMPALLSTLLKAFLMGDWDDPEKLKKKIAGDQLSYMLGTVVGLREATAALQAVTGTGEGFGYTGPASVRFFSDLYNLGTQIHQGEADAAFWKSLDNVGGVVFHYPAGQINRTATGIAAMADGKTENPLALIMGVQKKH